MKNIFFKLNFIITSKRRLQLLVLIFLLLVGIILEIFGITMILPIIGFISDEKVFENYPKLINFLNNLNLNSSISIQIFLLITLGVVYFIKTFFLIVLSFFQNKFIYVTIRDLHNSLFKSYINQPYETFHKKNSSDYIKVLQTETGYFTTYLGAIINLITESALSLAVLLVLIYIEPIGAFTLVTFFLIVSYSFYQLTRGKLKIWGTSREKLDRNISQIIHEGFSNIREIKIFDTSTYFLNKLKNNNFLKAKITYLQTTLIQSPRFFLELVSVIGLILFILSLIFQESDLNKLISTLGVFVAGSFRILPSLNRIITSRQYLKYYDNILDVIYNELHGANDNLKEELPPIRFNEKIHFSNISFKYLGTEKNVLENINMEIKKGSLVGVIGDSGSGKSTLIDILSGLLKLQGGEIRIDNKKLDFDNYSLSRIIGYVSQRTNLLDSTIIENIAFGDIDPNIEEVKNSLIDSQLMEFINTLPNGIYTKIGENGVNFSGGQIQRISIARALYRKPQILIFDEATSALDSNTERKLIESIGKLKGKMTIIMIAHRLTSLSKCDYVYELKKSNIILKNNIK
ncbi:MAG: ABC transporter ATP-binding protein [Flavobacteriaceae bacterium]|nr:ABC transporter ATP-binding protein [Flavobacteriaceae bacterium]